MDFQSESTIANSYENKAAFSVPADFLVSLDHCSNRKRRGQARSLHVTTVPLGLKAVLLIPPCQTAGGGNEGNYLNHKQNMARDSKTIKNTLRKLIH